MNEPADAQRLLVVNADDLGFVPSVTRGILEAIRHGIVRSASLMSNMANAADAAASAGALRDAGHDIGVGLHFNMVVGEPLSGPSSLTNAAGRFHPLSVHVWRAWRGRLDLAAVERELRAQLDRAASLLSRFGLQVTHIDSHRHAHCLPGVYDLVLGMAREYRVPHVRHPVERQATLLGRPHAIVAVRALRALVGDLPAHDEARFAGVALMRSPVYDRDLLAFLAAVPAGITELMVHPGYDSPELAAVDRYRTARERELRGLTSPAVRARLEALQIRLTHFGAITRSASAPRQEAPATP